MAIQWRQIAKHNFKINLHFVNCINEGKKCPANDGDTSVAENSPEMNTKAVLLHNIE